MTGRLSISAGALYRASTGPGRPSSVSGPRGPEPVQTDSSDRSESERDDDYLRNRIPEALPEAGTTMSSSEASPAGDRPCNSTPV